MILSRKRPSQNASSRSPHDLGSPAPTQPTNRLSPTSTSSRSSAKLQNTHRFLSDWKSTPIYYESKWFNLFTSPTGGQASYTPSQLSILVLLASPLYFAQYRHAALYFDFENVHTTTGTILLTQEPRIKSTTQIQKRRMISSPR